MTCCRTFPSTIRPHPTTRNCRWPTSPPAGAVPNFCTFCDRSVFGRKLRQRSAQNIAEEIEYLSRHHHVREIAFVDENFTVRPKLIYELFDILDQKGLKFPWTCMSRVDTVNYEVLEFMKEKGLLAHFLRY